jgi:hypothetical protein
MTEGRRICSTSVLLLFLAGAAYGRCVPTAAYEVSFEVLSCDGTDPHDRSKNLGYGVILELNVLSRRQIDHSGNTDWWPDNEVLPRKVKVFYDTKERSVCRDLKPGTRRTGTMRALCCDGAEPRCDCGVSVGLYRLKK